MYLTQLLIRFTTTRILNLLLLNFSNFHFRLIRLYSKSTREKVLGIFSIGNYKFNTRNHDTDLLSQKFRF
jgi:hypothetical protein